MVYFLLLLSTMLGGMIQGLTGFGSGIVMMQFYPKVMSVVKASAITSTITLILNIFIGYSLKDHIRMKKIILPLLIYGVASSIAVNLALELNEDIMLIMLGSFFIFLSIYNFLKKEDKHYCLPVQIGFIVLGSVFSGLFGVGGPFFVCYFLDAADNTDDYMATSNFFYFLQNIYISIYRVYKGIITINDVSIIGIGMVIIIAGMLLVKGYRSRIDETVLRKLTYGFIGISGFITVVSHL